LELKQNSFDKLDKELISTKEKLNNFEKKSNEQQLLLEIGK
jgi:hypothetical protein